MTTLDVTCLFQRKLLTKLEPYFKEDFQAEMTEDNTKIAVTYTFFKRKSQEPARANAPLS